MLERRTFMAAAAGAVLLAAAPRPQGKQAQFGGERLRDAIAGAIRRDLVRRELLRLSDRTAERLRAKGLCGRTVTIKVRFSNFKTITRSRTLEEAVDTSVGVYDTARALYLKLDPDRPRIRLLGVSVSGLATGPPKRQLQVVEGAGVPGAPKWSEVSKAVV